MGWVHAFSEMFELSVEEQVYAMAPEQSDKRTVYTEEDLREAYGDGTSTPDIMVYYGTYLMMFEVVSGRLTMAARSRGDLEDYERRMRELVQEKFKQLGVAANAILEDEAKLTGEAPMPSLKIVPVVVQADMIPGDALSLRVIKELADETGYFNDPRIVEPSSISSTELDMLEGLYDRKGIEPHVPIRAWKGLPTPIAFREFLVAWWYGPGPEIYRSKRMLSRIKDGVGETIADLMGIR